MKNLRGAVWPKVALLFDLLLALLLAAHASCGDDGDVVAVQSPAAHRNVMVIDDGIDESAADLHGKVIATFTAACPPTDDDGDAGARETGDGGVEGDAGDAGEAGMASFDETKRAYIAALGVADQRCELRPGIEPKPDPLAAIDRYRARWNGMIRGQKFGDQVFTEAELDQVVAALDPVLRRLEFHGTTTAGTVAHDNPEVRLVLIDRTLGSAAETLDQFQCVEQSSLDLLVALLSDPEVHEAYVHAPTSRYTDQFREIIRTFNVGLINESYGSSPRATLTMLQEMKGCDRVDARAYFGALHDAQAARLAADPPPYFVIQSAGNESQQIDSGQDTTDCIPENPRRILVGSTDLQGGRSDFSNFGTCVGVVAPGEHVIAPYPGGWLFPLQGTSYAAPLVTRYLSQHAREPFDPARVVADLQVSLPSGQLKVSAIPRDFFYAPRGLPPATGALFLEGTRPARLERVAAQADLEPFLAPLRTLRAIRRHR